MIPEAIVLSEKTVRESTNHRYTEVTNQNAKKILKETVDEEETENISDPIMPILYQIMDAITALEKNVKSVNSETIETVIKSMQKVQPQVSPDTALQMQLIGSLMQNPENFMKLIELSEKVI